MKQQHAVLYRDGLNDQYILRWSIYVDTIKASTDTEALDKVSEQGWQLRAIWDTIMYLSRDVVEIKE